MDRISVVHKCTGKWLDEDDANKTAIRLGYFVGRLHEEGIFNTTESENLLNALCGDFPSGVVGFGEVLNRFADKCQDLLRR